MFGERVCPASGEGSLTLRIRPWGCVAVALALGAMLGASGCSPSAQEEPVLPTPGPAAPPSTAPRVVVNGVPLNAAQLEDFRQRYGALPAAGDWWYDARSGLFGPRGGPAAAFMFPGHDFAPLAADASSGDAPVFINGRQLPMAEVGVWAQLVGGPVMPGRYWFDAQGNVGYEGMPYPIGNLYLLAQGRMAQGGSAGGGDNGWNTRFSSGNYNSDNSAGYVAIPGVGVIGSYGVD